MAHRVSLFRSWCIGFCAVGASGCTVGPAYQPPSLSMPAHFSEGTGIAASEDELAAWWLRFEDPHLNRLIEAALARNLDVRDAASRIREARAGEVIAGAAHRPRLDLAGEASHRRLSENAGITLPEDIIGSLPGLPGSDFSTFRLGF